MPNPLGKRLFLTHWQNHTRQVRTVVDMLYNWRQHNWNYRTHCLHRKRLLNIRNPFTVGLNSQGWHSTCCKIFLYVIRPFIWHCLFPPNIMMSSIDCRHFGENMSNFVVSWWPITARCKEHPHKQWWRTSRHVYWYNATTILLILYVALRWWIG